MGFPRLSRNDTHASSQHGFLSSARDIRRALRGGEPALIRRREQRLVSLISFARTQSPYYSYLYRRLPADVHELQALPPVSKAELMDNFDDWVTDRRITMSATRAFASDRDLVGEYYLDEYALWTSSGTTGEPGIFIHDDDAMHVYAALGALRGLGSWLRAGDFWAFLRQGFRAAIVIATGGPWAGDVVKELVRRSHPSLSERILTYSVLTPMAQMVDALNEYQPSILLGYPTALALLAHEQVAGRLVISPLLVTATAEWLTQGARSQITGAFSCPVRETYAASEFMGIAYSCDHDHLHVNHDWVILEPVDGAHQRVPAGEASETVLLTNLANRIQPIIRYDLGDSITMDAEPCSCGNPLPSIQVEGRRDDVLYLLTPEGSSVPILPMALAAVVECVQGVTRYQIIQTAPTVLRLRIETRSGAGKLHVVEEIRRRLRDYLAAISLPSIEIEVSPDPPARDPVSGKYRHVWAEFKTGPAHDSF